MEPNVNNMKKSKNNKIAPYLKKKVKKFTQTTHFMRVMI